MTIEMKLTLGLILVLLLTYILHRIKYRNSLTVYQRYFTNPLPRNESIIYTYRHSLILTTEEVITNGITENEVIVHTTLMLRRSGRVDALVKVFDDVILLYEVYIENLTQVNGVSVKEYL